MASSVSWSGARAIVLLVLMVHILWVARAHHRVLPVSHRVRLLQLQQQGWVFDFNKVVDIFQSTLHQLHFRLHRVVAEGDRLANHFFGWGHEFAWKKLDELKFNILHKIKLCWPISVHHKHGQKAKRKERRVSLNVSKKIHLPVGLLNAVVSHISEYICVLVELHK